MKKIISMVLVLSLLCTVGAAYAEGNALCFETQLLTDEINHDNFRKNSILRANEKFMSETIYRFSVF